jgi:hypothetical protein
MADPDQWPLLHVEGDLAIFGWRDPVNPATGDQFRGREVDLNRLAFRPTPDKKAPRRRSEHEPEPRMPWEAFWRPAPPRPIDRDEAALHLLHAVALRGSGARRNVEAWDAVQSAALVGAAGGWTGPAAILDAELRLLLVRPPLPGPNSPNQAVSPLSRRALAAHQRFAQLRDESPPALLYLALRAARRAIHANPDDAQAHLTLGECYLQLMTHTRERGWGQRMSRLVELRSTQASAALNRAVALNPDLAQGHAKLAMLYRNMGYLDLAVFHLAKYVLLARKAGPPPGASAEQFRAEIALYDGELARMAGDAQAQEDKYRTASPGRRVLERATIATNLGLAGLARDMLLESDVAAFGPNGMALELELLLKTGRVKDVLGWTEPGQKAALGSGMYHWLRGQAFAASGDYALAAQEFGELSDSVRSRGTTPRELVALAVGRAVLDEQPSGGLLPLLLWRALGQYEFGNRLPRLTDVMRSDADLTVLRGLVALEEGDVEEAEVAFRLALEVWGGGTDAGGLDFEGRVIAQDCLEWLKAN